GGGGETPTVLVDFVHDEVASSFLAYFPDQVSVHPGDTVVFRQEWTGEPHSVTMGTQVDEMMALARPFIERFRAGDEPSEEELAPVDAVLDRLPWMMDDEGEIQQNGAQPCYLDEGLPPEDPDTPCADEQQVQPAFTGRQSYYNSGFIPYQGPRGNQFRVPLADDIAPGTYSFYCNLHGPLQSGSITVVPADRPIPSAREVAAEGRAQVDRMAQPLLAALRTAQEQDVPAVEGEPVPKPLAGWFSDDPAAHATINEFVPRTLEARVGQPITWNFVGGHTVSFDVPEYFSEFTIDEDGRVSASPLAFDPQGLPEPPASEGADHQEEVAEQAAEPGEGEEAPPPRIDAGQWDGSGFLSSGVQFDGTFTVTFTQPGSYPYACLIHPQMVGEVMVR
ncbi:MAG: hypothetical protein M3276_02950, partial [Actinomycetota bacterium]|nr:hypothetical protein [Actinomycetota bacterium]